MQHIYENVDYTKIKPIGKMSYQNRVNQYRIAMYQTLVSRLVEILPYLISYENLPETMSALQIETQLRINRQDLIIGVDKFDRIVVLGRPVGLYRNGYDYPIVTGIDFTVDETQRLPRSEYSQIIPSNPHEGNYILLRNRFNPYFKSEIEIIEDYCIHLAELQKSRYSLALQSNVLTYFKGVDVHDNNTVNELMDNMFEGAPFIKIESALDLDNNFGTMDNAKVIPAMLVATKDEYDNKFNELLNMLGVMNLGVAKEAGITSEEASASTGFLGAIENISVKTRQDAFDLLNTRFNLDIKVGIDQTSAQGALNMIPNDTEESSFGRDEKDSLTKSITKEGAK